MQGSTNNWHLQVQRYIGHFLTQEVELHKTQRKCFTEGVTKPGETSSVTRVFTTSQKDSLTEIHKGQAY